MKLVAKSLFSFDKEKKIIVKEQGGKVYLLITPKRYIGLGSDVQSAISNANMNTFNTGWRVENV